MKGGYLLWSLDTDVWQKQYQEAVFWYFNRERLFNCQVLIQFKYKKHRIFEMFVHCMKCKDLATVTHLPVCVLPLESLKFSILAVTIFVY